jgi:hypothetical protein
MQKEQFEVMVITLELGLADFKRYQNLYLADKVKVK